MVRLPATLPCTLATVVAWMALAHMAEGAGPEATSLLPSGAQRGTTVEVTAGGKFPKWPVRTWIDRAGITVTPESEKGKLSFAVAADAAPGVAWLRLYDADGASAARPFIIGTLAEIVEREPNNTPDNSQSLAGSALVVNGCLQTAGDVDVFGVTLQKGQTLVADLDAHETLGSPVDAVLQILAPSGKTVLAYNHDNRGLDPRIVFVAPSDGQYLVRVFGFPATPNSTIEFAGGSQYAYRLTLTTAGFVDYPWPLAATAGQESRLELFGWNLPETLKSITVQPHGEAAEIFDQHLANMARVAVEPHPTLTEVEPNDTAKPQPIELPTTVTGRLEGPQDVDAFAFAGHKGQLLVFQVESRALGYPLDAVLEVIDSAGKSVAKVDDIGNERDPKLIFSPPDEGTYRLTVCDLNRQGSSRHVYRLRAAQVTRDFGVSTDAQAYVLTLGKPLEITLTITRENGFDEAIAFTVAGLGTMMSCAPVQSTPQGDAAKPVKLILNATDGTFSGPIQILGESQGVSKLSRKASVAITGHNAKTTDLWLTVRRETTP
ncbi:MAG TPA: PPC domain-containing protein [Pirellulales bacterium]|nr:PPC domain-containing protein [Pirellulales bacterium]